MGIKDRRFNRIVNTILREELQKGNLPSSKEFIWRLNQYLQANDITKPSLNFKPIRKDSPARSVDFNEVIDNTYQDLEMLYINAVDQHNKSLKHINKFEVEKSKLSYELKALEDELKELILLYGQSGYLNSLYDVFADMSKVDTDKTTCNVDIGRHEVRMTDIKKTSKKIDVQMDTAFEVAPFIMNAEIKTVSGTTADAITETNTTWQANILVDQNIAVPTYFTVAFASIQEINRITLSLQSIKSTFVRLEATKDNINWFKIPYYEDGVTVESQYTFDFPKISVSKVRALMAKDEPDNESVSESDNGDKVKYSYLFGIKNISFYTFSYALESEFYSGVLDAQPDSTKNFTIDKVSLMVDEEVSSGTDIKYYIALPATDPEWKSIDPVNRQNPRFDQLIDFKNISTATPTVFSINPSISIGEYEQENLYTNGIKFYKIGEVQGRKIIDGTEKLFVGKNTWGIKWFKKQQADHADHIPSIEDWREPAQITNNFVKITDGKPGLLLNKMKTADALNYMFTLGVFSNKDNELVSSIPASNDPIAIYINGELLFKGIPNSASRINYLFKTGWNELIVLCYTNKSAGTVNGSTLDLNLDPRKYGANVYSKTKALTKVPIFDLRYNIMNTDNDKFSIVDINDKSLIILNYAIPGLEYDFYYNYIDGTVKDKILFKTVMTRDQSMTETTPKLKSYRLRFS